MDNGACVYMSTERCEDVLRVEAFDIIRWDVRYALFSPTNGRQTLGVFPLTYRNFFLF